MKLVNKLFLNNTNTTLWRRNVTIKYVKRECKKNNCTYTKHCFERIYEQKVYVLLIIELRFFVSFKQVVNQHNFYQIWKEKILLENTISQKGNTIFRCSGKYKSFVARSQNSVTNYYKRLYFFLFPFAHVGRYVNKK